MPTWRSRSAKRAIVRGTCRLFTPSPATSTPAEATGAQQPSTSSLPAAPRRRLRCRCVCTTRAQQRLISPGCGANGIRCSTRSGRCKRCWGEDLRRDSGSDSSRSMAAEAMLFTGRLDQAEGLLDLLERELDERLRRLDAGRALAPARHAGAGAPASRRAPELRSSAVRRLRDPQSRRSARGCSSSRMDSSCARTGAAGRRSPRCSVAGDLFGRLGAHPFLIRCEVELTACGVRSRDHERRESLRPDRARGCRRAARRVRQVQPPGRRRALPLDQGDRVSPRQRVREGECPLSPRARGAAWGRRRPRSLRALRERLAGPARRTRLGRFLGIYSGSPPVRKRGLRGMLARGS